MILRGVIWNDSPHRYVIIEIEIPDNTPVSLVKNLSRSIHRDVKDREEFLFHNPERAKDYIK